MSNRTRVVHTTRASRARAELWKRAFVWIFIVLFTFTVAGGLVAIALR